MEPTAICRDELKNAYLTMTVQEAARKFGVSVVKFYDLLDRAGIDRKMPRKSFVIVDRVHGDTTIY
jgi:hypothetical protein